MISNKPRIDIGSCGVLAYGLMAEKRLKSEIWMVDFCVAGLHYQIRDSFIIIISHHADNDRWHCNVSSTPLRQILSTAGVGLNWQWIILTFTFHKSSISMPRCMLKKSSYCNYSFGHFCVCGVMHKANGYCSVVPWSNLTIQCVDYFWQQHGRYGEHVYINILINTNLVPLF